MRSGLRMRACVDKALMCAKRYAADHKSAAEIIIVFLVYIITQQGPMKLTVILFQFFLANRALESEAQ